MAFTELTIQQQQMLGAEDKKVRAILRQFMQLVQAVDFLTWEEWSNQNITPILALLKSDDVLPNTTDLAGAQDLQVTDLDAVRSLAKQLFATAQDQLPLIVKAIGINAGS